MSTRTNAILVSILACGSFASAQTPKAVHWSYEGKEGPAQWGSLDAGYATCATGKNQSPVNLSGFINAELPPIKFAYQAGGSRITNNGHTQQVDQQPGSHITIDGTDFELKQFHFHAPSEHTINGRSYPLEAHFVHADAQGNLAVVGAMLEAGAANAALAALGAAAPTKAGDSADLAPVLAADALLPADRDYYRYSGSLTTPPCTEGVRWLVLKHPVQAKSAEIAHIAKVMGHANNRPVAPAGARPLLD